MNKNELVSHVAAETSATRATAERMVGAVFAAIGDALRGTSPLPSPDSGRSSFAAAPGAGVAIRKPGSPSPSRPRRCRRSRRQGPSRRGQRIAWWAKRPGAGRSSRQRRRDRCTPSPCLRDEALGLEDGSFPCACVRPIDEPALHASRGRLTSFTPRAIGLASGRIRWAVGCLWQRGEVAIWSIRQSCEHMLSRAPTSNPLVRGFLILPDGNFPLRQRCPMLRNPTTLSVSAPLTPVIKREPVHRVVRPARCHWPFVPIGPVPLRFHSP